MIREQLFQTIPYDMKKHLTQSKLLDTVKLAAETEEYASLNPKYWQKHSNRNGQNSQQGKGKHFQKGDNKHDKDSRKHRYDDTSTQNDKPKDGQDQYDKRNHQGNKQAYEIYGILVSAFPEKKSESQKKNQHMKKNQKKSTTKKSSFLFFIFIF